MNDNKYNRNAMLEYWNKEQTASMYDKYLLATEISLIKRFLEPHSKILDAGCGEGEGTMEYAGVNNVDIDAVDFSETRLQMAKKRLEDRENVRLKQVDFLQEYKLGDDYDYIISQRFLINLTRWELQQKVLRDFKNMLKPGGTLLMLEGSVDGVNELNRFRSSLNMEPIPVKWHNLFFRDDQLENYMMDIGFQLNEKTGLGSYFLLTRGLRPFFDNDLNWNCQFNRLASEPALTDAFDMGEKYSRLKLWVFKNLH
jgi:ubiquinone/menaquinone biosynthesis C-methylase UbiE